MLFRKITVQRTGKIVPVDAMGVEGGAEVWLPAFT
jgi:hypothetical protein